MSETMTTRCHQCGFAVPTFDWEDAYGGIKAERDALRAEVERLRARIEGAPVAIVGRCAINSRSQYDIVTSGSPLDGERVRLVVDERQEG